MGCGVSKALTSSLNPSCTFPWGLSQFRQLRWVYSSRQSRAQVFIRFSKCSERPRVFSAELKKSSNCLKYPWVRKNKRWGNSESFFSQSHKCWPTPITKKEAVDRLTSLSGKKMCNPGRETKREMHRGRSGTRVCQQSAVGTGTCHTLVLTGRLCGHCELVKGKNPAGRASIPRHLSDLQTHYRPTGSTP